MILLHTQSLKGYGLNRVFQFAKKAGFDGITLAVDFTQFDTFNKEYLQSLSKKTDLPITALYAPDSISTKQIQDLAHLTKELQAQSLILQAPKLFDRKTISWIKKEVPKIREQLLISIAIENPPEGKVLGLLPEFAFSTIADLNKFKHASLNTSNIAEKKQDLMRIYESLKKVTTHITLSNFQGTTQEYAPLQDGILPLESFLHKLKTDKVAAPISIKISSQFLNPGEDDKMLAELERAKDFCHKYYT